jgi:putative SOS response-associated peptidase YedK
MCGRFTQMFTWQELVALYLLSDQPASNLEPRYNISPTQEIGVIVAEDGSRAYRRMRWGLVPGWWKKSLKEVPSTFNARGESVAEKPMFRSAFQKRRCLVPASGFFEWTGPKPARQPHYITAADGGLLTFPGLHEFWRNPETGEDCPSATIIITAANGFMSRLHDRMPVVLAPRDFDAWLSEPRTDLLKPAPEDALREWPVSAAVNSSRYEAPEAIVPVAA